MESYSRQLTGWRRILLAWMFQGNLGVQSSVVHLLTGSSSSSQGSFPPHQGFDFCVKGLPVLCLQSTLQFCDPYNHPLAWFFRSLPWLQEMGISKEALWFSFTCSKLMVGWYKPIMLFPQCFWPVSKKATHLFNSYDHYTSISFRHSTIA